MRVFESNGITSVARLKGKNCNHHSILEMSILKISILFFFIFFYGDTVFTLVLKKITQKTNKAFLVFFLYKYCHYVSTSGSEVRMELGWSTWFLKQ